MDRKSYEKEVYSKYWITAREKIYGFSDYEKALCGYMLNVISGINLLEVAIGTGYPFADFFQKKGYMVHGIDISPDLIEKCKKTNSKIAAEVGDAENLDFPDNSFDCVYCFNATWHFPDLPKAISEMVRVTAPGGSIFFDIQNRNNPEINECYQKQLSHYKSPFWRGICYAKNIVKIVLQRGTPDWHFVIYEVPTYPESVYEQLKNLQLSNFYIIVKENNGSIQKRDGLVAYEDYPRLVFCIRK